MRIAKCIILMFMVLFGFVMQNEIFHRYIGGVGADRYLSMTLSYSLEDGGTEYAELITDIENIAKEKGVHPYAIVSESTSDIEHRINIYCDEFVKTELQCRDGVYEKEYKSFSSGNSKVSFSCFSDLKKNNRQYASSVLFIGEKSDIMDLYEKLAPKYEISHPAISEGNEADMTCTIWVTIDVIMVLMTVMLIAARRKEVVVKVSMGQNPQMLIVKNILTEISLDFCVFIIIKWFCSYYISGEYMEKEFTMIYALGSVVSALLYLWFAVYDIKIAFSNLFVSKNVLKVIYLTKFIVTVGTIFTVCTNYELMNQKKLSLYDDKLIQKYEDYCYITISSLNPTQVISGESYDKVYDIANQIYVNGYEEFAPVVSTLVLKDDDKKADYVLVNEHGADTIANFLEESDIPGDADVVVFVPKRFNNKEVLAEIDYCLSKIICDRKDLKIKTIEYEGNKTYSYVDRNLENNINKIKNPIIIYAGFPGSQYKDLLCISDIKNVMFKIESDVAKLENDFQLRKWGFKVILTNVAERFRYYNSGLKQVISFCSAISVFMLLLQTILIYIVVLFEYRNNAMELSIKKILGYGFGQRCWLLLLKSGIYGIAATVISIMIGLFSGLYRPMNGLIQGVIIILGEMIMDMCFVMKNERTDTMKVLKGGCL